MPAWLRDGRKHELGASLHLQYARRNPLRQERRWKKRLP